MYLEEIIQIVTSGLLGIFVVLNIVNRKNYKELLNKYMETHHELMGMKQRNDLFELYSKADVIEKVNGSAIRRERKPSK